MTIHCINVHIIPCSAPSHKNGWTGTVMDVGSPSPAWLILLTDTLSSQLE